MAQLPLVPPAVPLGYALGGFGFPMVSISIVTGRMLSHDHFWMVPWGNSAYFNDFETLGQVFFLDVDSY